MSMKTMNLDKSGREIWVHWLEKGTVQTCGTRPKRAAGQENPVLRSGWEKDLGQGMS